MKKLLTIFFLIAFISNIAAEISVKSFRKLENDLDARVNAPLKDFNGDISAIIKVVTTQTGFDFDCGQAGIVKTVNKPSEIWVYVPYGVKRISIMHPQLGQLRDYIIPMPIDKATVYEMVVVTGKVITTVEETIESQWLVITPEPADASVYLDEVFVKSGIYQAKLKPGSYSYRIEAPLYHNEAGKVEITNAKKEITTKLKPAFGYVSVSTSPEKDAKVIIDGKTLSTNTPCKSEALASGEHTVQVIKEMYQPAAQKIFIADGQTTPINLVMQPNFAELTLTAPTNAALYVNNEKRATGSWSGRLNAGVYSLEARLDKHRTAKQDIEIVAGDKKTIDLQPTPIYGSLDVITTPTGANISINGKDYGTTPNTISKLLIGECTVLLSINGYTSISKLININEGGTLEINENFTKKKAETIDELLQEAYSRCKEDVDVSHILIRIPENATPADTLIAWGKINAISKRIEKEDFVKVANEVSEDESAKDNKGYIGWISAFRTVYPFETVAYNTKAGTVSKPVRTAFGYHIIKVHGRRESKGEILVAHIMKFTEQGNDLKNKAVKIKIDSIYDRVKAGDDFGKLANDLSDDKGSATKNGELPWFGSGRMVLDFENAAFALKNIGDVSAPILSPFGWHIIKLIEKKGIASYADMKAELEIKIKKDERGKAFKTEIR